jgi:hypothetical protein
MLWGFIGLLLFSAASGPLSALVLGSARSLAAGLTRLAGAGFRSATGQSAGVAPEAGEGEAGAIEKGRAVFGEDGEDAGDDAEVDEVKGPAVGVVLAVISLLTLCYLLLMAGWFMSRDTAVFTDASDAFYWAFVTATSIGFGDFAPDAVLVDEATASASYAWMYGSLVVMAAFLEVWGEALGACCAVCGGLLMRLPPVSCVVQFCVSMYGTLSDTLGQALRGLSVRPAYRRSLVLATPGSACGALLVHVVVLVVALAIGAAVLSDRSADGEWSLEQQGAADVHAGLLEARGVLDAAVADANAALDGAADPAVVRAAMDQTLSMLQNMGTCDLPACPANATCADETPATAEYSSNWEGLPAALYLFTVASTVGYGHFNVQTKVGKRFVMWFSLFGMWFFGNLVDGIVAVIAPAMLVLHAHLHLLTDAIVRKLKGGNCRAPQNARAKITRSERRLSSGAITIPPMNPQPVTAQSPGLTKACGQYKGGARAQLDQSTDVVASGRTCYVSNGTLRKSFTVGAFASVVFLATLLFFMCGAWVFHGMALVEDEPSWESLREGVWFMFVTCTTIGFGDMTPNFMQVGC